MPQSVHPPHLPPKSCDVEVHHRWRRLKLLGAAVVFGLIAGMSGASMMLGWIWPRYAEEDIWITSYGRAAMTRAQLEDHIREELSARIVGVYDNVSAATGTVQTLNQKIADGIIVSSDGWLAMYYPQYDGSYKNLGVLTADRTLLHPEAAVVDAVTKIIYLKVHGQFKVVSFAEETLLPTDDLFVFDHGSWRYTVAPSVVYSSAAAAHIDTAPVAVYNLNAQFSPGSIAINLQSRVAGVINDEGRLLPARAIARVLPSLLGQRSIAYPSLGVEGWFNEERPIVVGNERIAGFFVSKVVAATSLLRKGDVLQEVNGRVVNEDNLWYTVTNNQKVELKVFRGGKELLLTVPVTSIKQ